MAPTPPINNAMLSILANQSIKHIRDIDSYYNIQFSQTRVFCEPVNGNPFLYHKPSRSDDLGLLQIAEIDLKSGTDKIRARALLQLEFDRGADIS